MDYKKVPIILDAFRFVVPLVLLIAGVLWWGKTGLAIVLVLLALFVVWFFRNPERTAPPDPGVIVSPADGRVLKIEEVDEDELLGGTWTKVSIFMSIFNVHVNRSPCQGVVRAIRYRKGKFFSANMDKASTENERNSLVIETDGGTKIAVIQIAGLIARRIVCWVREEGVLQRGERFGLIRFGSRLEVFMPVDSDVLVKVGDRVKAGYTKVGKLP